METTITLGDTFAVSRAGSEVSVDISKLPVDIIARLVTHGLTQKVGDSASAAVKETFERLNPQKDWDKQAAKAKKEFRESHTDEIAATGLAMMQKTLDSLYEGEWGVDRGGDGLNEVQREAVRLVRKQVQESDKDWYKNAEEKQRWARMVEYFEGLDETKQESLLSTAKKRLDAKAAAKAALDAIEIEVDL